MTSPFSIAILEQAGSILSRVSTPSTRLSASTTSSSTRRRTRAPLFAARAKEPFAGIEKDPFDAFDRQQYADFWRGYDRRLERALRA